MSSADGPEVENLWPQDLAVLAAFHARLEAGARHVRVSDLIKETEADPDITQRSTLRLHRAGYLKAALNARTAAYVQVITEKGLRALWAWPAEGQEAAEMFVALLTQAIEDEPNADKRSKLVALRDATVALGIGTLAQVLGNGASMPFGWN